MLRAAGPGGLAKDRVLDTRIAVPDREIAVPDTGIVAPDTEIAAPDRRIVLPDVGRRRVELREASPLNTNRKYSHE